MKKDWLRIKFCLAYLIMGMGLIFSLSGCQSMATQQSSDQPSLQARNIAASKINTRLGLAYLAVKNYPRAKAKLLKAVNQNPKSVTALNALAFYSEVTKNPIEADKDYQSALQINPNSGLALNNYGTFLCQEGKYQKAESYILRAAHEADYVDTAAAFENAGLCALRIPDLQKAANYFRRAVDQDPKRATSYFELAKLAYVQGKNKIASDYLNEYSTVGVPNPESLWLGIRVAKRLNDSSGLIQKGTLLAKKFPKSKEYALYQETL